MKKILLTCYFLDPNRNQEGYTSWKMAEQIARHQEVTMITRKRYQQAIEKYWEENDFRGKANMQVLYYGGKNSKANSSSWAYYRWQWGVVAFIKKQKINFDLAQDINWSFSQVPTFLWRLQKPVLWCPAKYQPTYPSEYVKRSYGSLRYGRDRMEWMMRRFFWQRDPFLKKAREKSTRIIVDNAIQEKELKLPKAKCWTMASLATEPPSQDTSIRPDGFEILSKGAFTARNGFDLTIKSFARFYKALPEKQQRKTRLTLLGTGPEERRLKDLIFSKGLEKSVRIIHWLKPEQMDELYRHAALFLFPSHGSMGMGIPQAMAHALPVLCLDNAAGTYVEEHCGRKVAYGQYEHTVDHLTTYLHQFFMDKSLCQDLSEGAYAQFQQHFSWDSKGEQMRRLYAEVLEEKVATPTYTF